MSAKSNKNPKKQDLAEKVQEIQKRQKNWLKQRDEHKQSDVSDKSEAKNSSTPLSTKAGKSSSSTSKHTDKNQYNSEYSVEKTSSPQSKDKFQTWMEAREKSERLKLSPSLHEEPDILHISSSRTPGFATPDLDWEPTGYNCRGSHLEKADQTTDFAKSLMSHQDFDEIANKIVARVKNELDIPYKSSSKETDIYPAYHREDFGKKTSVRSEERDKGDRVQEDLSSHYCPECKKLMLSPDHVPMILTPCAHSLCQACCQGRSLCPQCACTISSKTCNIMLLQIVQNHQKTRERTVESRKIQSYSPDNYREKAKTRQHYQEEYENLQTRQEVLQIESKEIQGHMTKLDNKIAQQQQQIQSIEREEKKVKDKIQSLKEKLVELETHKREYDQAIHNIEMEKNKDRNKLNMVQDTLSSIGIEMEKLRILLDGR